MGGKSIMWRYIAEEQNVLKAMPDNPEAAAIAAALPEADAVYIVAHGSSYNAAVVVADFLSRYMQVRVSCFTPANFIHNCHSLRCETRARCIVIAISQTGTSRGLLEAVSHAETLGFAVTGITQVTGSPLSVMVNHCLYLPCGAEDSNAKTKGYGSTLLVLMLLGMQYGLIKGRTTPKLFAQVMDELRQCTGQLNDAIDKAVSWCRTGAVNTGPKSLYVLGAGMNFGTAMEGQLKLIETMCIPAMFNDVEEFSHGMHRAIDKDSGILLLCTDGPYKQLTFETFFYLLGITGHALMIYAGNDEVCHEKILQLPDYPLTQSVLPLTAAVQVLSVFLPEARGLDPNRAANDDYTEHVRTRVS